jgi:PadR family transcriptional regulator, regulatory protein PadR
MTKSADLLQGTLDLLILKVLSLEPMHGWAMAQRIEQLSRDALKVNQGALYPALHRLEHQAWIAAEWGESENNRRAKYYSLTKAGRDRLKMEEESWDRLSVGVQGVLNAVRVR